MSIQTNFVNEVIVRNVKKIQTFYKRNADVMESNDRLELGNVFCLHTVPFGLG